LLAWGNAVDSLGRFAALVFPHEVAQRHSASTQLKTVIAAFDEF
jgi:hypothetical protein